MNSKLAIYVARILSLSLQPIPWSLKTSTVPCPPSPTVRFGRGGEEEAEKEEEEEEEVVVVGGGEVEAEAEDEAAIPRTKHAAVIPPHVTMARTD